MGLSDFFSLLSPTTIPLSYHTSVQLPLNIPGSFLPPGPLHLLFALPRMPSLQISLWLAPSYSSHFFLREGAADNLIQSSSLPTPPVSPHSFTLLGMSQSLQLSCLFVCPLIYFPCPPTQISTVGQQLCLSRQAGSLLPITELGKEFVTLKNISYNK